MDIWSRRTPLLWLPIIGPLLFECRQAVQAVAADRAKEEIRGAIRRLVFWTVLMIGSAVVAVVAGALAIGDAVLRAIVIGYTIEGLIKGMAGWRLMKQQLESWPAYLFDITRVTIVRAGGIPLASLFVLYLVAWCLRKAVGDTLGFSFAAWIWNSLAVW